MYEIKVLGLAEAEVAVRAVIEEAKKGGGRPVTVAVADPTGKLISLARMDGASWNSIEKATQKAYTSAVLCRDTKDYLESKLKGGWASLEPVGPGKTVIPGGLVVTKPGDTVRPTISYGAIGVSGETRPGGDEHLASVGLKAIQDFLWPS